MDPLSAILNIGNTLIDKIFPDKDKADQVKLEMLKLQQAGSLQELVLFFQNLTEQLKVNAQEALHASVFVAGWRPFIGWICGVAIGYNYILMPFIVWVAKVFYPTAPPAPELDMTDLLILVGGMLGIAGLRSREVMSGKR